MMHKVCIWFTSLRLEFVDIVELYKKGGCINQFCEFTIPEDSALNFVNYNGHCLHIIQQFIMNFCFFKEALR
jgi:hypothetical protein